jgi:hypothetical protein
VAPDVGVPADAEIVPELGVDGIGVGGVVGVAVDER